MCKKSKSAAARRRAIARFLKQGVTTAGVISARYGVSERTVYRDVEALRETGLRILGEAGYGYMLRSTQP